MLAPIFSKRGRTRPSRSSKRAPSRCRESSSGLPRSAADDCAAGDSFLGFDGELVEMESHCRESLGMDFWREEGLLGVIRKLLRGDFYRGFIKGGPKEPPSESGLAPLREVPFSDFFASLLAPGTVSVSGRQAKDLLASEGYFFTSNSPSMTSSSPDLPAAASGAPAPASAPAAPPFS